MCRRKNADPLVRLFVEKFRLNLLSVPREDIDVGFVYASRVGVLSDPGRLERLVPSLEFPLIERRERLEGFDEQTSDAVSVDVGGKLVARFLDQATGAKDLSATLQAQYTAKSVTHLFLSLQRATRDWVDPIELGTALAGKTLPSQHPFVQSAEFFYVVTGVVRVADLKIRGETAIARTAAIDADALEHARGAVAIDRRSTQIGEVTFSATEPLAIGIEVHRMSFDPVRGFSLEKSLPLQRFRAPIQRVPGELIGEVDGDAFVELP